MATSDYVPKIPAPGGTPLKSPYSGATWDGFRDDLVPSGTADLAGAGYGEDDWANRDSGVKLQSVVDNPFRQPSDFADVSARDWPRGDKPSPGGISDT